MSGVVHNPNNWHWVDKNCLPWAKEYFNDTLLPLEHSGAKVAKVKEIKSVAGDCDVTQRKGKVRCIFELKVEFVVTVGSEAEDSEAEEITIILPEFEHDYDSDDFNFEIRAKNPEHKSFIKKEFLPVVTETVFLKFQPQLLKTHEPELKHNTD